VTTPQRVLVAAGLLAAGAVWLGCAVLLWDTVVPGNLELPTLDEHDYFTRQQLEEAESYESFLRWDYVLSQVALVTVLGLYAWRGARFMKESAAGRIGTGMLLGMIGLALVWIVQLPFSFAAHWWQRRHDVTDMGYVEWFFSDWAALAGEFMFICLALLIVMGFAGVLGDRWWVAGAPLFVGLGMFFAFLYPYLVTETEPLRDPELRAAAERLAAAEGVPDIEVKVEDVREYTTSPNAYAAGLGESRVVVLWNTILDFDEDEVVVVLAHEFAHHARDHLWEGVGWYALFAVPGTYLIARFTRRRGGMARPEAVPLSLLVVVLLQLLAQPIDNVISRHQETEADWVALDETRDPEAARDLFRDFTAEAGAEPDPPTWAYVFLDSHPTIMQRIAMVEAWEGRSAEQGDETP
jgi:STE24 endopeptidase